MQGKEYLSKLYYKLGNAECRKALPLFDFIATSLKQLMEILVKRNALFQRER